MVFEKGDPGDALYIIVKGQVKVILPSGDGNEALLATMDDGDFFGELSMIDGEPRSATILASLPTDTIVLRREGFYEFLRASPDVAIEMLQALSRRLRQSDEFIADAAFLDVPGRLAKKLLELSDRYGKTTPWGTTLGLQVTQRELAAMIGATRESVNKHLQAFRVQGFLRSEGRRLVITDRERLARRIN
ncbi:MAG: Crp/Fnr family transcriptional regulator [Chloroflexi bacterium]|nr:Crp/Fnr family transcriptional regulator [Chloroflexota bacterium]